MVGQPALAPVHTRHATPLPSTPRRLGRTDRPASNTHGHSCASMPLHKPAPGRPPVLFAASPAPGPSTPSPSPSRSHSRHIRSPKSSQPTQHPLCTLPKPKRAPSALSRAFVYLTASLPGVRTVKGLVRAALNLRCVSVSLYKLSRASSTECAPRRGLVCVRCPVCPPFEPDRGLSKPPVLSPQNEGLHPCTRRPPFS